MFHALLNRYPDHQIDCHVVLVLRELVFQEIRIVVPNHLLYYKLIDGLLLAIIICRELAEYSRSFSSPDISDL